MTNTMNDFGKKHPRAKSPLEILREIGIETASGFKKDFEKQVLGKDEKMPEKKNFSGEIMPGEALEIKEVYTGKRENEEYYYKKTIMLKELREQDKITVEKRTNELRIQIKAIHEEIIKLAHVTPELSREVDIAAFQAPVEPSTYEMFFLERLFEFIKSFREKIEDSYVWLSTANRRAAKKNVWGQNLKKHGSKYLLSAEHYLQRSAG